MHAVLQVHFLRHVLLQARRHDNVPHRVVDHLAETGSQLMAGNIPNRILFKELQGSLKSPADRFCFNLGQLKCALTVLDAFIRAAHLKASSTPRVPSFRVPQLRGGSGFFLPHSTDACSFHYRVAPNLLPDVMVDVEAAILRLPRGTIDSPMLLVWVNCALATSATTLDLQRRLLGFYRTRAALHKLAGHDTRVAVVPGKNIANPASWYRCRENGIEEDAALACLVVPATSGGVMLVLEAQARVCCTSEVQRGTMNDIVVDTEMVAEDGNGVAIVVADSEDSGRAPSSSNQQLRANLRTTTSTPCLVTPPWSMAYKDYVPHGQRQAIRTLMHSFREGEGSKSAVLCLNESLTRLLFVPCCILHSRSLVIHTPYG